MAKYFRIIRPSGHTDSRRPPFPYFSDDSDRSTNCATTTAKLPFPVLKNESCKAAAFILQRDAFALFE